MIKRNKIFKDILEIEPFIHKDERGFFYEKFNLKRYKDIGLDGPWVQDNLSKSKKGDVRGLHFQNPNPQGKLVSVIVGCVFDVVVDVRKNSSTFANWFGVELNDKKCNQLWIPPGFAHGFQVISDVSLVNYKCSLNYWSPDDENIILYNDPDINIKWPMTIGNISKKDKEGKFLKTIKNLPNS